MASVAAQTGAKGPTLRQAQAAGMSQQAIAARTVGRAMSQGLDTTPERLKPAVQPESVESDQTAIEVAESQNTEPEDSKIKRARTLLESRSGWQDSDFAHYSRAQILRRAEIAEKAFNREAKLRAENEALRKQLQGQAAPNLQSNFGQGNQASASGGGVATPSVDVKALAKKLARGDEDAEAELAATLQSELNPALSRLAELGQHEQSRLAEGAASKQQAVKDLQSSLASVYSEARNDDDFQEFLALNAQMAQTARYARSAVDEDVAEECVHATASALGWERVGERDEPTSDHGDTGQGFMDFGRNARPKQGAPNDAKEAFMANVRRELKLAGFAS